MATQVKPEILSKKTIAEHKASIKKWQNGYGDAYDMAQSALTTIKSHEDLRLEYERLKRIEKLYLALQKRFDKVADFCSGMPFSVPGIYEDEDD